MKGCTLRLVAHHYGVHKFDVTENKVPRKKHANDIQIRGKMRGEERRGEDERRGEMR